MIEDPYELLRKIIDESKMTMDSFSKKSGIPLNSLYRIITKKNLILPKTSKRLAKMTGSDDFFWLKLFEDYHRKKVIDNGKRFITKVPPS